MEYKKYKGVIPESQTVKKWLMTRKYSESEFIPIGKFEFPGFYTTQNYKWDGIFFWLAFIFEIGFLVTITLLIGGWDMLLSLSAISCVLIDYFGAYFHHKNQDEICRAQLALNVQKHKDIVAGAGTDEVKKKKDKLDTLKVKPSRILGLILILGSAFTKVIGSAILFEIPALTLALTIVYCFVAYVHIYKTGFYVSGYYFYKALDRDLREHIMKNDAITLNQVDPEKDFDKTKVENIPKDVSLTTIRLAVFDNLGIFDSLIYENNNTDKDSNSLSRTDGAWYYVKWKHHFWDDSHMLKFINSKSESGEVLSDNAKAFIAADISERNFLNN
ncbi:MAG: hypothetical protein WAT21_10800 [Saprospiraceae bacterium]